MIKMPTKRPFLWKLFLLVWIVSTLASLLVLPYSLTLMPSIIEGSDDLLQIIGVSFGSNLVFYAIVSFFGLHLAARIGLGLPFTEGWLTRQPIWEKLKKALLLAVAIGAIVGVLILALDLLIFSAPLESQLSDVSPEGIQGQRPPPWQGLLAAISAGITEEVLFRLLVVSLLAWIGGLVFKDDEGRPKTFIVWISIFMVAIAFGLAHLPATAQIGLVLNPLVITRAVVLNGIGGVAFGWLYWKWGLESAILSHFTTDVVLHVIFAAIVLNFPGLFG